MPCDICGAAVKNPSTPAHTKSKRHQNALELLGTDIPLLKPKSKSMGSGFESRISDLEKQMKYVIARLNSIDQKLSSSNSRKTSISKDKISKVSITRLISQGDSINLDDLEKRLPYSWNDISNTLIELIDDEEFDVVEAKSKRKLYGRFGRIIRR